MMMLIWISIDLGGPAQFSKMCERERGVCCCVFGFPPPFSLGVDFPPIFFVVVRFLASLFFLNAELRLSGALGVSFFQERFKFMFIFLRFKGWMFVEKISTCQNIGEFSFEMNIFQKKKICQFSFLMFEKIKWTSSKS